MRPLLPIAFLLAFYPLIPSLELDSRTFDEGEEKVCACPTSGDTYTVTTTADSGDGSLREAITCANNFSALNNIIFDIPGSGPHIIQVLSALPTITGSGLTMDGGSGFNIEINGSALTGAENGLSLDGATSCTITGLMISSFPDDGINVTSTFSASILGNVIVNNGTQNADGEGVYINNSSGSLVVVDNYIGVLNDGVTAFGNSGDGVDVFNSTSR